MGGETKERQRERKLEGGEEEKERMMETYSKNLDRDAPGHNNVLS